MADKRISQLVLRTDIENNDVVPIVASGATTTNKATISSIQTFMQENLDVGVTSVGITLGSAGTDVNVTGSPITTSGNITINIPDASTTARGVVTTGSQTFGGVKTFADGLVLPSAGGTNQASRFVNTTAIHQGSAGSNRIGFNSGNNIYFGKGLDNGGVIQWNNAAVRYYTLQDADGTIALTSQLDGYVTLDTAQTITAQKTFTTSGSSDTMIISHGSGNGFALDVIKAGNNEAIRVTKTSGSGNAMTISGGNFEAGTIVKTGGTSSQFLKADGSVDSSTYLTTSSASSTYVPYTGATSDVDLGTRVLSANNLISNGNVNSGALLLKPQSAADTISTNFFKLTPVGTTSINFGFSTGASTWKSFRFSSVLLTDNTPTIFQLPNGGGTLAVTTDLGAYLPLTGGTLTGALNGTSASFTGNLTTSGELLVSGSTGYVQVGTGTLSKVSIESTGTIGIIGTRDASDLVLRTNLTPRLTLASTGAATFSSSVTASSVIAASATFSNFGSATSAVVGFGDANTGFFRPALNTLGITTAGTERMRITSGGNVDMGTQTANASERLRVVGLVAGSSQFGIFTELNSTLYNGFVARFYNTATSSVVGSITQGVSATSFNTSSDYRLKENVQPVEGAMSKLTQLKPCTFNFIADPEKEVMGFLAHEVQEVIPQAVHGEKDEVEIKQVEVSPAELDEEGNVITEAVIEEKEVPVYQGIDHSKLVPLLVAAIQELKTEIDSLKNQIK